MAKKTRGFTWIREDQEEEPRAIAERRDVHEARALKQRLKDLARRLAALSAEKRARLPLDAELLAEIENLATQAPKSSRRRQSLRVQQLLRDRDLDAIEDILEKGIDETAVLPAMLEWQQTLLDGDEGLQTFLVQYPAADRQQLRALSRKARGEGSGAERALKKLQKAIEQVLRPSD